MMAKMTFFAQKLMREERADDFENAEASGDLNILGKTVQ